MRRYACLMALALAVTACGPQTESSFQSGWRQQPDRDWAGPEYWANRLQDWRVREGRLECVGTLPMRTVHLLTRRLGAVDGDFELSVWLGSQEATDAGIRGAGFLAGAGGGLDYRAAALVHHSYGPRAGLYAGLDADGRLSIRDFEMEDGVLARSEAALGAVDSLRLTLTAVPAADGYALELRAESSVEGQTVSLSYAGLAPQRLEGNVALVCDPAGPEGRPWFRGWTVAGTKLEAHDDRVLGPLVGSQHTLSRGTLKLTAQLIPIGPDDDSEVELQQRDDAGWTTIAAAPVVVPGYTATFRIDDWDAGRDVPFRLHYVMDGADYYKEGVVRRDPVDKDEIVVAAFTGNHNVAHPGVDRGTFDWSTGLWFPHGDIVRHVRAHEPDFLFFSGDQVYEGASPTRADFEHPVQDYLYKWYLWYWAFGELTAQIPSVAIPDDHDVYHGNVWGAGGVATPPGLSGAAAQDAGGYKLSPQFVNMVQRTQASHLPDPYDPTPVAQGIEVYYTDILYGGVSFAVIEDRKWKSAPAPLLPDAEVWNGWPQNPRFEAKTQADAPGAQLLGDRQLRFLEDWASDWSGGAWMKVVLSQTIFANVATLPDSASSGSVIPSLPVLAPGAYAENEKQVSDMDSNGWPQSGRNAALRAMRKGFAVHLAGDQHLGSTIQYGVDDWGDAGYALCVPSIANFWPRRWFPPQPGRNRDPDMPRYTGDYEEGFGNKITVLAVSNPHAWGRQPGTLHDRSPGYGIARFDRTTRQISLANWPRWADPRAGDAPYPGWPVTFGQQSNYGREAVGHLPPIDVSGMRDPVVQVIDEASGEAVYAIRIRGTSFTPKVFEDGSYTVIVGEPGTDRIRTLSGLRPAAAGQPAIAVAF
ncbi:MAG TPA: alkaline phosphatase D family protein [Gemmatimonadota bacterium]|nr:alkaline phosphatase D family protein [Gemmatimonadota bacterium]